MNLIVTDKCTNSCPYCFAASEMSKTKEKNILEKEDIDTFLKFLKDDNGKISLNVIGGEPFIYKHIDFLLEQLYNCEQISNIVIFTGGVVNVENILNVLKYRSKVSLLFNLNEKSSYLNPKHHEIVIKNIETSIDNGIKTGIGYNIYKQDFNPKEIIRYCNEFGVSDLRFAVASPMYGEKSSNVISTEYYNVLAPKVFSFLKLCYKKGIKAHLDCTLPFCFFTDRQMGEVAKMHPQILERFGKCGIPIDINHDLTVFRCFSFSNNLKKKLSDFKTIDEISEFYRTNIDSTLNIPSVYEKCKSCVYKYSCNGGCLSNNSDLLSSPLKEQRVIDIYHNIEKGEYLEAESMLNEISSLNASDKLLEMHLHYNNGNLNKAIRTGREAINLSKSQELTDTIIQFISSIKMNKR
jgi:radical SAM protein with 4Fe4S-binding SPASM domain